MARSFLIDNLGLGRGIEVDKLYKKYLTPESGILDIHGMPLHYRKTGAGPALLLIHGIGSCLHTWNKWHDILSDKFTVISLDLPGFGLTGPPPDRDFRIEKYMEAFDHLLDHLKIRKAHVAGNSLGGFMAWNYAGSRPERVQRIVLMNSAGFMVDKKELSDVGFMLSINPWSKKLSHRFTPRSLVRMSLENCVMDRSLITEEKVTLYHDHIMRRGNRESFSDVLEGLIVNGKDNTSQVSAVKAPTLIMWGDRDALINVEDAFRFKRCISDSQMIIYEGIGHLPMLEIPERSAADVRGFLGKQAASTQEKAGKAS